MKPYNTKSKQMGELIPITKQCLYIGRNEINEDTKTSTETLTIITQYSFELLVNSVIALVVLN